MRSFKQFLAATGDVLSELTQARMPFSGSTRHSGYLGLPDLQNLHDPGHTPIGGYQNVGHLLQTQIDRYKYRDADTYILAKTLEKMAALAENVVSAIVANNNNPHNQGHLTIRYRTARFLEDQDLIVGLPFRGIVANGGYPELRPEDVTKATNLGVLIDDPYKPDPQAMADAGIDPGEHFYAINLKVLRPLMAEMREKLVARERGIEGLQRGVGHLSGAFNQMTQGGVLGPRKNIDPLGGGH